MKKLLLFCGVLFLPFLTHAQSQEQNEKEFIRLDSIVVEASRAGTNTPVSHSRIGRAELELLSPVNSVPMLLSLTPSVVYSTEGGNGLGYSSMRIRGSDGSRINVTLNGVALNDGESQEIFWVNIPSLFSYLQDIQVQRGVGTSVNGPGAFGASVNMRTLYSPRESYGNADFSVGSYNTFTTTVGAGTGITPKGFSADFKFSRNTGDGYIRNAKTKLNSFFGSLGWYGGKKSVKINYIYGDQKSGITWEGISRAQMEVDRRYNPAGSYYDAAGNIRYYDNETDNYTQHHIQGHFATALSPWLSLNATLHYTRGDGYYENYKANRRFSEYGLPDQLLDGVAYKRSDVIIRQAMGNNYMAFNANLRYVSTKFTGSGGVSASYYDGDHFGNLLWSMYNSSIQEDYNWYLNTGKKSDISAFARGEYSLGSRSVVFADLQYRLVDFSLSGEDRDFVSLQWSRVYNFFNPKGGLTINLNKQNQFYASLAVGRREPSRSDVKESIKAGKADELKPERLLNYEVGYRFNLEHLTLSANAYFMEYKEQLVPTGRLSETGYVIKENVPQSYRRGVEVAAAWRVFRKLKLDGNITFSTNKIVNYKAYLDMFDNNEDWNPLPQAEYHFDRTEISFSPPVTGMVMATYVPTPLSSISLDIRYVGRQYMSNMQNRESLILEYYFLNLRASKTFEIGSGRYMDVGFFVNNLLNRKYFSNGWIYMAEFGDGSKYVEEGLYPQAEINFTARIAFRF